MEETYESLGKFFRFHGFSADHHSTNTFRVRSLKRFDRLITISFKRIYNEEDVRDKIYEIISLEIPEDDPKTIEEREGEGCFLCTNFKSCNENAQTVMDKLEKIASEWEVEHIIKRDEEKRRLEKLTTDKLKLECKERKIKGYSKLRKHELIDVLLYRPPSF